MKWYLLMLVTAQAAYEWGRVALKQGSTWGMVIDASCWTLASSWLYASSGLFR